MLATKKRALRLLLFSAGLAGLATACTPAGPRNLLQGERLIGQGKYVDAVEKLETASKLLGTSSPEVQAKSWNYLGLAYHYSGKTNKAIAAYGQALVKDRNLAAAQFNLGNVLLEDKSYPAAIDHLTTYVTLQPASLEGWLQLATAQMRLAVVSPAAEKLRQLENARKSFEKAQSLSPTAEGWNGLGLIFAQRNRPREAAQSFNSAVRVQPTYAPALLNLAVVHHQMLNDRPLALQKYHEYLALAPTAGPSPEVVAVVHQLEAELHPAPPAVIAMAATNPPTAVNRTNPAVASINGLPHAVATNLTRIPETNLPPPARIAAVTQTQAPPVQVTQVREEPRVRRADDTARPSPPPAVSPETNLVTGAAESEPEKKKSFLQKINPLSLLKGKKKTAPTVTPLTPATNRVIIDEPRPATVETDAPPARVSYPRYRYQYPSTPADGNRREAEKTFAIGVSEQRAGHTQPAQDAYAKAIALDPGFFEAYYNSGLAAFESGDLPAALKAWEISLAIQPGSANARYNFALALQRGTYIPDAANELERLLKDHPAETRAHLLLGNIYAQQLDNRVAARLHYRKVLDLEPGHPQATAIRYWLVGHP